MENLAKNKAECVTNDMNFSFISLTNNKILKNNSYLYIGNEKFQKKFNLRKQW